jgi:hypothetical protein
LKRNIKLNNDIGLNLTLNPMIPLEEFFWFITNFCN